MSLPPPAPVTVEVWNTIWKEIVRKHTDRRANRSLRAVAVEDVCESLFISFTEVAEAAILQSPLDITKEHVPLHSIVTGAICEACAWFRRYLIGDNDIVINLKFLS